MDYEVVDTGDIPVTALSEMDSLPIENDIRQVDAALAAEEVRVKLWYFQPGEEVGYHAHLQQEEIYHVLDGEFSLKLGDPEETEIVEVGPGAWWLAKPQVGHGHRYVGDDRGVLVAIAAPAVDDEGVDPRELHE